MNKTIFSVFLICLLVYSFGDIMTQDNKDNGKPRYSLYSSWDYQEGDIILELFKDSSFVLEVKKWDSHRLVHTEIEKFEGKWQIESDSILRLFDDNGIKISYGRDNVEIEVKNNKIAVDSWRWLSSSTELKLDGIELADKEKTDSFFLNLFKDELDSLDNIDK